jgi:hypothetical protein
MFRRSIRLTSRSVSREAKFIPEGSDERCRWSSFSISPSTSQVSKERTEGARHLADDPFNQVAVDICQAEVPALESVGEPFVIDAREM